MNDPALLASAFSLLGMAMGALVAFVLAGRSHAEHLEYLRKNPPSRFNLRIFHDGSEIISMRDTALADASRVFHAMDGKPFHLCTVNGGSIEIEIEPVVKP